MRRGMRTQGKDEDKDDDKDSFNNNNGDDYEDNDNKVDENDMPSGPWAVRTRWSLLFPANKQSLHLHNNMLTSLEATLELKLFPVSDRSVKSGAKNQSTFQV